MPAPVTALEALEDLVEQLAGSSFTDREGRPLDSTQVYRTAVQVLEFVWPVRCLYSVIRV